MGGFRGVKETKGAEKGDELEGWEFNGETQRTLRIHREHRGRAK
jgi:hypothetical protein